MPVTRVDRDYERRLASLLASGEPRALQGGLKGVEKESLRVTPQGRISQAPHPSALGSALTNDHVTTDYSEALLELITPPFETTWELLQYLCDVHQFAYRHIGDELLWATSMPCALGGDASIPIARYGSSNIGRLKYAYRVGLGLRYGRAMQAISGVHFNYSFPEHLWPVLHAVLQARADGQPFRDETYFALLRNYRRYGWIIHYLFGVSPALCRSFFIGRDDLEHGLEPLGEGSGTLHGRYATTLRMSDLGYRNKSQARVTVSVNSLDDYVRDLTALMRRPSPEFQRLGVVVDGEWRQLSANVLQIENEYYSFIRPKRVARPGERPTQALRRAGVQYVEMRSLDVSAFDPVGVNQNKLRFLEAFAAWCVLKPAPLMSAAQQEACDANHVLVARRGREPGLALDDDGRPRPLADWAAQILDEMEGVAEMLDHGDPQRPYAAGLATQRLKVQDVAATPSARMLAELALQGESFFAMALRMSMTHKAYFTELHPPNAARLAEFAQAAEESLAAQQALERQPQADFGAYVAAYLAD